MAGNGCRVRRLRGSSAAAPGGSRGSAGGHGDHCSSGAACTRGARHAFRATCGSAGGCEALAGADSFGHHWT
ncbi:MAG: hypothetical protein ACTHN5_01930 [Phycisphaerae bacterium]